MVRIQAATLRRGDGRVAFGPVTFAHAGAGPLVLVGRNGAGKTTLLRVLYGLTALSSGRVTWDRAVAAQDMAFVFQSPVLLRRSVLQNLTLPLHLRGQRDRGQVQTWAGRMGLTGLLDRQADCLSGGEKQRVALARAFLTAPRRIVLDEPTANLDRAATRQVEAMLQDQMAGGGEVILSTHSVGQLERMQGAVVFMDGGRATAPMPTAEFLKSPPTRAAQEWLEDVYR